MEIQQHSNRGDEMKTHCVRTCFKYKARKPFHIGRYAVGQKRCQNCEIFVEWDGVSCPCCGRQLRTLPRSKKGKEKYLLQRSENA
jgi:hypothetical protein